MYVCVFVCARCQVISWWNCGSLGEWKSWNSEQSSLQSQFQLPNLVILKLTFTSLWGCCLLKDSHQELHGEKSFLFVITDTQFNTWKLQCHEKDVFGDITDSGSCPVLCSKANMMNSAHTYVLCQKCDIMNVVLFPRSKLQRDQDRDISELIALGVPNPRSASEAQYDQRLFNQSRVRIRHTYSPTAQTWMACVGWTHIKP